MCLGATSNANCLTPTTCRSYDAYCQTVSSAEQDCNTAPRGILAWGGCQ
uniref:Snake toxin/toxin-like domain-containing protein n=1 Tax=Xenopus tropicalis TaxID=8364 RepID=A0A803JW80_XENTR